MISVGTNTGAWEDILVMWVVGAVVETDVLFDVSGCSEVDGIKGVV